LPSAECLSRDAMAAAQMLALLSAVRILTAVAEEVAKLALGEWHVCAVGSQGSVKCWGGNSNAMLGQGDVVIRGDGPNEMGEFLPTIELGTGRHALEVKSGAFHNCARLDDGLLKCWGPGSMGNLGYGDLVQRGGNSDEMGDFLPTVELGTGRTAVQLALGYEFGCVVLDDASVKCWGAGSRGQLGIGTEANMGDGSSEMGDHLPPVDLGTSRTAAEVTAGSYFTCARLDDSSVKCWGNNEYGQLGLGSTSNFGTGSGEMGDNLPAVDLGTGRTAVELSAGAVHMCARLDNGSVKCWGRNREYQLGLGLDTTTNMGDNSNEMGDYLPPVDLGTGRTAAEVASGNYHTCARLDDGAVRCWGKNDYGELGHTGTLPSNVDLGTGRTAVHVAVGNSFTCAVLDNQETKCWGRNDYGTLGLGDTQDRGKSSSDMGNSLPAVDIVFPTTTTTTSTTISLTMTSSSSTSSSSATITISTTRTSSSTSSTSSSSTSSSSTSTRTVTATTSTSTTSASTSSSTGTSRTTSSSSASRTSSSTTTLTSTSTTSVSSTGTTSSATSSTAATDEAREVMRKQEAEAAVKEAEAATEVAVQDLLKSLNNTGDNGVMGEVVDTTEAGALKVVAYDVEALMSSGQNATVSMENSSIGAEVPVDVLAQAQVLVGDGPVLLGVVSLSEDLAKKFSNPPADGGPGQGQGPKAAILRSSPIVVEVRNKNGGIVDLGKLQSPMVVQLEVPHDNGTVKCAYWNEREAFWETDGLVRLELRAGVLRCQTHRLGIFGGVDVFEELENVLKCSSLSEVLTADGIAKLARPGWLLRTPTVIYLCFLLLFALLLSYGHHMDRQAERAIPSKNRQVTLLREDDGQKATGLCRCNMLRGLCSQVAGQVVFLAGLRRPKQFAKKRIQSLIDNSISQILAYRMGLDMISINALIPDSERSIQKLREEEEEPMSRSRGCFCQPAWMKQVESRARNLAARAGEMAQRASRVHPVTSKEAHSQIAQLLDLHRAGNSAVNTVLRGNMRALTLELLPAVHAYSAILRCYSITPVSIQICAIILKILSACFINAIFLTSSAKREDVEGCDSEMLTFEQQLVRGFWIGLLSAVLSDVIILCLLLIQKPSPKKINQEKWDQQVSKWRCRRCVFWVAAACYAAVCVFYVLVFLASVTYEDSQAWLGATSWSLLKEP